MKRTECEILQDASGISKYEELDTTNTWSMQPRNRVQQLEGYAATKPWQSGLSSIGSENKDFTPYDLEMNPKSNKSVSKLQNLQKQRAYLLGTGIYNVGDCVIAGLDQEIQVLMTVAS